MAVAFRSASSGTDLTTALPAGHAQNDVLLAQVTTETNGTTPGTATGWTLIDGVTTCAQVGRPLSAHWYWIARGGSAPATDWTAGGGVTPQVSYWCFTGSDTTAAPTDFIKNSTASGADTVWELLTFTNNTDQSMQVAMGGVNQWTTSTSTLTNERVDGGATIAAHFYDNGLIGTGSVAAATITCGEGWHNIHLALKPDAGGTPPDPPPVVTFVAAGSFAGNITVATQAITAPACQAYDILIAAVINKSVTANAVTPPDATWTAVIATEVNDCTTAADDHQYSLYWHRATAADSGAAFTFTKATDDNVLFGGVMVAYRGAVTAGSPLDATAAARTETAGATDNVTFPAYDPTSTNNRTIFVAYYGQDVTTFAAAMSADTNPDCTKDVDVESSLGTDCSIAITSGTNDGASIASRTWAAVAGTTSGNTGVVFALVAQYNPTRHPIKPILQAVRRAAVR